MVFARFGGRGTEGHTLTPIASPGNSVLWPTLHGPYSGQKLPETLAGSKSYCIISPWWTMFVDSVVCQAVWSAGNQELELSFVAERLQSRS